MKITGVMLAALAEQFNSHDRQARRKLLYDMNQMYEGGGREMIISKIRQEFSDQDAIKELEGRLVTLNIMKKIIDKSAGVYNEAPSRMVVDENESDSELLEDYEDATRINVVQKESNRHLKMYKRCLRKFYTDGRGRPRIIVKPAHAYEVFNLQNEDPVEPDIVAELIQDAADPQDQIIHWWSDESFWITDGKGEVKLVEMSQLLNAGINPVGKLPFNYRTTSSSMLNPIVEDDLLHLCISIPIVLTDVYFALKYQCWSMIYTINADGAIINVNPASIISLKGDPGQDVKIGQIKPEVDSDKVIRLIEATINLMLSSKGLSAGVLSTGISAKEVVSGVSKMLDSAESVSDKYDQQDLFIVDESDMWDRIAYAMIPYWRKERKLNNQFNKDFSQVFQVAVVFKEPKAMLSEKERTEIGVIKIENGLMSRKKFIQDDNPDFTDEMIDEYIAEIDAEKAAANVANDGNEVAKDENGNPIDDNNEDGKEKI